MNSSDVSASQEETQDTPTATRSPREKKLIREVRAAIGIAALACILTILGNIEAQREILESRSDLQKQLADLDASSRQARALAAQSQSATLDIESKLSTLDGRITDTQTQQTALSALYRDLSVNKEEVVLAEVEQAVAIANQELLLAGDVRLAIRAMEDAERRLERIDRPSLQGIRRVVDQDLRRLRAVPIADVSGMSLRLENLANAIDQFPLAASARPNPVNKTKEKKPEGFWAVLGDQLLKEIGESVRIQRNEGDALPPLAPDQTFFLRQNLRIRLLSARQSLLTHDDTTYRGDLKLASRWLDNWYDKQDRGVRQASETLKQMIESPTSINLPDVTASLNAIRDHQSTQVMGRKK
jgi:uroporphyrin-III C-methyltransferase